MNFKTLIHNRRLLKLFRFFVAGLFATAVDFSVLALGVEIYGLKPERANILAFIAAVGVSYVANKYFTFQENGRPDWRQALKFFLVSLGGFCLNYAFFVELLHLGLHYISAKLLTVVLVAAWNFFVNNYWTFSVQRLWFWRK